MTLEQELEHTKELHGQSVQNAEAAKQAVKESETRLKDTLSQQDQLLMQAQQAEMQQQSAEATNQLAAAADSSAPTMDSIRDKIESRYTTALGQQELAEATGAGQSTAAFDAAQLEQDSKSRSKLDEIRSSMGLESGTSAGTDAIEQGTGEADPAPSDGADPAPGDAAPGTGDGDGPNPTLPRDTRE